MNIFLFHFWRNNSSKKINFLPYKKFDLTSILHINPLAEYRFNLEALPFFFMDAVDVFIINDCVFQYPSTKPEEFELTHHNVDTT